MNALKGKKIISILIVLGLILQPALIFSFPKKVEAQLATIDAGNIVQTTISAISNVAQQYQQWSNTYKENILDPLAYYVAKTLLRSVTTSVVQWINSGFEGSPSFLSDVGGFFEDIVGEEIGKFIAGNSDLRFLCSPFSINVRLSLAFKYRPFKKKVTCTLDDVIKNVTNAVAGASINGFTAGDFRQGGWPAFASLSTEPQNNIYGAYLTAEAELDARLGNLVDKKKQELNQGAGFLSYEKCRDLSNEEIEDDIVYGEGIEKSGLGNKNSFKVRSKKGSDGKPIKGAYQACEVYTPGSVIAGGLQKSLGAPVDELNLADEFNEIVNALFAQLLSVAITGGLRGVSGNGASDRNSYINQIRNSEEKEIKNIIKEINKNVNDFIKMETEYKTEKQKILQIALNKSAQYEEVALCFERKAGEPGRSSEEKTVLIAEAAATRGIIIDKISPLTYPIITDIADTDTNISILTSISLDASGATSSEKLSPTAQLFNDLIGQNTLHDARDLGLLKEERKDLTESLNSINPSVADRKDTCSSY